MKIGQRIFMDIRQEHEVEASDIKQSFSLFKFAGTLSNAKNADFSYKLGAG